MDDFESEDGLIETQTNIVVKNLPAALTENGIRHLFGNAGKVKRVMYRKPLPNKQFSSAVVVFDNGNSAETAIRIFNNFKIGGDGPTLRVVNAKTREEKIELRKQRALEEKTLDDIRRMPGFSKQPWSIRDLASATRETLEHGDRSQSNISADASDQKASSPWSPSRQIYVVDEDKPKQILVMDESVDLSKVASELKLLHFCRKCGKECAYMCCDLATYCSIFCQKGDRTDHKAECRATI